MQSLLQLLHLSQENRDRVPVFIFASLVYESTSKQLPTHSVFLLWDLLVVQKGDFATMLWGNLDCQVLRVTIKVDCHSSGGSSDSKRCLHPTDQSSAIYNSQDKEATYVFINRWQDKESCVKKVLHIHTHTYISGLKKKRVYVKFRFNWVLSFFWQTWTPQKTKMKGLWHLVWMMET